MNLKNCMLLLEKEGAIRDFLLDLCRSIRKKDISGQKNLLLDINFSLECSIFLFGPSTFFSII